MLLIKYSSYTLVFTCVTHFLCCGIPLFLGISSTFTNLVVTESLFFNFELFEEFEIYFFILASLIFLFLILHEIYQKNRKCDDNSCFEEEQCGSTKKRIRSNLLLSGILYFFNSSILLSEIFFN